jgi:hypothetical protein
MVPHVPTHLIAAGQQRQKVIQAFRSVEATAPGGARTIAELAIKDDDTLRRLRKQGVIRSLPDGRIYLDDDRLREQNATAARIGLTIAFIIFLIIVVVLALRP